MYQIICKPIKKKRLIFFLLWNYLKLQLLEKFVLFIFQIKYALYGSLVGYLGLLG